MVNNVFPIDFPVLEYMSRTEERCCGVGGRAQHDRVLKGAWRQPCDCG